MRKNSLKIITMELSPSIPSVPIILLTLAITGFNPVTCMTIEESFCINFKPNPPTPLTSSIFFKDDRIFGESGILRQKNCMVLPPTKNIKDYYVPHISTIKYESPVSSAILNNWIRYQLDFTNIDYANVEAIIIQADNDKYVGFGQFMAPVGRDVPIPLPTQFMPCTFQQSEEPLPATIFVYTHDAKDANLAQEVTNSVHLFWKFSNTMCNNPGNITFRGIFALRSPLTRPETKTQLLKKIQPLIFFIPPITITLSKDFYGQAPGVIPVHLHESTSVLDVDYNNAKTPVPWLGTVVRNLQSKQSFDFAKRCTLSDDSSSFFGCGQDMPKCENPQTENVNVVKNRTFTEYSDYIYHRLQTYCFCPRPFVRASPEPELHSRDLNDNVLPLEPKPVDSSKKRSGLTDSSIDGIGVIEFPGDYIWNFRIIHGIAHVLSGLFITPLSIFMTRNFKETFMRKSIMFNKPWFIIHMLSVFINFLLHACGFFAIFTAKGILGVNKNVTRLNSVPYMGHRMLGYWNTILFIVLMLLGGIRCYNSFIRKLCVAIHWLLGMVYYVSTLYLIALSTEIPGSPSDPRKMNSDKSGKSQKNKHFVDLLVMIWLSVDIGFNIAMMVLSYIEDRTLRIHRKFWVVPIPSLSEFNRTDIPGGFLRKILLVLYICISLGICGLVCFVIIYHPQPYQGYGNMTCTHSLNATAFRYDVKKLKQCQLRRPFDPKLISGLTKKKINLTDTPFKSVEKQL